MRAGSAALLLILLRAGAAEALPILAVDADPSITGVQTTRAVAIGVTFSVDIVIQGVEASAPLQAFELDLAYGSGLTPTSVQDGGFLLPPVFLVQANLGSPEVGFAEATLGATGASGSGVVATLQFLAAGQGISSLQLNDVLLSKPFGVPISVGGLAPATITVVPEPSTAILVSLGLACTAGARRPRILRAESA